MGGVRPGSAVQARARLNAHDESFEVAMLAELPLQAGLRSPNQSRKGYGLISNDHIHGGLREPDRPALPRKGARGGRTLRHTVEPQLQQRVTSLPVRAARASSQEGTCLGSEGRLPSRCLAVARALGDP